jgi:HEAT repeat protein
VAYPPDPKECDQLFEELKGLDSEPEEKSAARRYEIIHDLAEARFFEAKLHLVEGLNNHGPDYRWSCVSALFTHWQDSDPMIVARLLDMVENDPDVTVRNVAIDSLGILKLREALPLLRRMVESEEDPDLRKTAYLAILRVLEHRPEVHALWESLDPKAVDKGLLRDLPESG